MHEPKHYNKIDNVGFIMIVQIVFYITLISGGLFGSFCLGKRFETSISIHTMAMVVVLYAFGLFNHLQIGVLVILSYSSLLLIMSLISIIKSRDKEKLAKTLLSTCFLLFTALFIVFSYTDIGMLAHKWDEFSHWMDSVKAMTHINDLITNPKSNSEFQSYPPAMSLFQYFLQEINLTIENNGFSEWRCCFAYKVLMISIALPLLSKKTDYSFLMDIGHTFLIIFTPLLFFPDYLSTTYIDPFIAMLTGCGFSRILFNSEDEDTPIYISLLCFILVLSKDIGLLFSIFIATAYLLSVLFKTKTDRKKAIPSLVPLLMTIVARLSWNYELHRTHATISFGERIEFSDYTKMFFLNNDNTYRQSVVNMYKEAFFNTSVYQSESNQSIPFFVLFLMCFAGLILLWFFPHKEIKARRAIICLVILMTIAYVYGLGAVYISRFPEREAVVLASYERYMSIVVLAIVMILLEGGINYYRSDNHNEVISLLLLLLVITLTPWDKIICYFSRADVYDSQAFRKPYTELAELIDRNCNADVNSKVYFISEGQIGWDYWITRFNARPTLVTGAWSLGESHSHTEEDYWSDEDITSAEEWLDLLNEEHYNYIALYSIDSYFIDHYSGVFSDPASLADNSLYRLNEQTGLYDRCY